MSEQAHVRARSGEPPEAKLTEDALGCIHEPGELGVRRLDETRGAFAFCRPRNHDAPS